MTIRLLTIDLDGTLVTDVKHIPTRTRAAITAAMAQGVMVALATGREYRVAAKVAAELGLNSPVICYNGNVVRDYRTDELVSATFVPLDISRQMIKLARQQKYPLIMFMTRGNYTELPSSLMEETIAANGTRLKTANNLLTLLTEKKQPIKFLTVQPAAETAAVFQQMMTTFGDKLTVVQSAPIYVEAFWPTASKGAALRLLAERNQIPLEATMAIGDHDNDMSMLEVAGFSVAMGNGSPGAKAAADVVGPAVEAEGVAWAIETYILGKG